MTNEELGKLIREQVFSTTIAKTKTFDIKMADMPANAILALLAHGTQRKFNDAVGGADKSAETKVELAEKMIADYLAGNVTARREGGGGVDELTKVMRQFAMKALKNAKPKEWYKQEITDAKADVRDQKLDKLIADNRQYFEELGNAELKRRAAEQKKTAEAAAKITIDI